MQFHVNKTYLFELKRVGVRGPSTRVALAESDVAAEMDIDDDLVPKLFSSIETFPLRTL